MIFKTLSYLCRVWGAIICTIYTSVFYDVAAVGWVKCWCLQWWMPKRKSHPNNCFPLNAHTSLFPTLQFHMLTVQNWCSLMLDVFTNIHRLEATKKVWRLYLNLFQRNNSWFSTKKCQAWKRHLILVSKYFTESEQLGYFIYYVFRYLFIFLPNADQAETCIWESLKFCEAEGLLEQSEMLKYRHLRRTNIS